MNSTYLTPSDALGELPDIGIGMPREQFNGRASLGVDDLMPIRAAPSRVRMEGGFDDVYQSIAVLLSPAFHAGQCGHLTNLAI